MKKIKIKFNGLGYNNHYQADVLIYDNGNLIFDGKTFNGQINICLKENKVYKVEAYFLGKILINYIYVRECTKYQFSFNSINTSNNSITFLLNDYHYDNLPIERGELILWSKT